MVHIQVTDLSEAFYPIIGLPVWTEVTEPPLGTLEEYLANNS